MKIREYLRDQGKWILVVAVILGMTAGILYLNHVPNQEVGYAVGIGVFVLMLLLVCDWYQYRKKMTVLYKLSQGEVDCSMLCQAMEELAYKSHIEMQYYEVMQNILQQQVDMQNEQLNKQQQQQDYYSMWVHQIKTPISALNLLLQQRGTESMEEQTELFRIEQYVEMALQYIRIDATQNDFVFESVSLEQVLRGSVRKYARQFINKKISLDFQPTQAKAVTDAKWLGFVVDQLISNAIKYTSAGKVCIHTEIQEESTVILIEDTGIGIRTEDLPRIWEKGYTGYNGHANEHSTGIGLYLCKQVVDKLGHQLTITSQEGKGTKVAITISNLTKV